MGYTLDESIMESPLPKKRLGNEGPIINWSIDYFEINFDTSDDTDMIVSNLLSST